MCRVLGVSRSWYYAQLKTEATKRQREDIFFKRAA